LFHPAKLFDIQICFVHLGDWVMLHLKKILPSILILAVLFSAFSPSQPASASENSTTDLSWTIETLDTNDISYPVSIAVDAQGYPHISYYREIYAGHELRYISKTPAGWTQSELVDESGTGYEQALALDPSGNPHLVYPAFAIAGLGMDLFHAYFKDGYWQREVIDTQPGYMTTVGDSPNIKIDSTGKMHVTYYDEYESVFKYASKVSGGTWVIETIPTNAYYGSLDLDPWGNPHLVVDEWGSLRYYSRSSSGEWTDEEVDTGDFSEFSLAIDPAGVPHIGYQKKGYDYGMLYATRVSEGWINEYVDTMGDTGQANSIAVDNASRPYLAYYNDMFGETFVGVRDGGSWSSYYIDDVISTVYATWNSLAFDRAHNVAHLAFVSQARLRYATTAGLPITLYSISGTITTGGSNPRPISGVTVSDQSGRKATTDASGKYVLANLPPGSYTLTPSKANYTFSPPSRTVSPLSGNATGQDFTGTFTGMQISHIEVFQGIQDNGETVPLIVGKPTMVRVYLDCGVGCSGISVDSAQLDISSTAGNKTYFIDQPLTAFHLQHGWNDQRGSLSSTFNFLVEPRWVKGESPLEVTFTVKVMDKQASVTQTFYSARPITLTLVPIQAMDPEGNKIEGCRTKPEDLLKTAGMVKKIYPTSQVLVKIDPTQTIQYPNSFCFPPNETNVSYNGKVINWRQYAISRLKKLYPVEQPTKSDFVFAWMPANAVDWLTPFSGGYSDPLWFGGSNHVAFGYWIATPFGVGSSFNQATLAHEIGHLLDLHHSNTTANLQDGNCLKSTPPITIPPTQPDPYVDPNTGWPYANARIPDYTMDLFGPVTASSLKHPGTQYDVMSYCRNWKADDVWAAAWTYRHAYESNLSLTAALQGAEAAAAGPGMFTYNISGQVFQDGTGQLDPAWIAQNGTYLPNPTGAGEVYCVVGETVAPGSLQVSNCFPLDFTDINSQEPSPSVFFAVSLDAPNPLGQVWLEKNGQVLDSLTATNETPSVTILNPAAGAVLPGTGTLTIAWQGSSPNNADTLTYNVLYSTDGFNWKPLAAQITDSQLEIDLQTFPATTTAQIQVQVSNGLDIGAGWSGEFGIGQKGTLVSILSPFDQSISPANQPIFLEGAGYIWDEPGAQVFGLSWESDKDGYLGTGDTVLVNLSMGLHHIRLWTVGPDGSLAEDQITLFIGSKLFLPTVRK
jgi:hypothetical protein